MIVIRLKKFWSFEVFFLPLHSSVYVDPYHCSCHNKTISKISFISSRLLACQKHFSASVSRNHFLFSSITTSTLSVTPSFLPSFQLVHSSSHLQPHCQHYLVKPSFNLFPPQCSWTQTLISHLCLHEISQLSAGLWFVFPFLVLLPVWCHNPCSAVCAFSDIFSCSALGSSCIFHM